jgi:hypothetical protein
MSEQNTGREDNNWRPKATGKGVPRLTADAAVGVVDYAHITPQEGKAIMGQSGTIRRDAYAYNSPALPVTAKVTWDNGKVADEKIVWDAVPAASYQKTGSFTA